MKKSLALILALLLTILIGTEAFFYKQIFHHKTEDAIIARVLDGDTVQLEDGRNVRLININTPEKGLPFSNEARLFLEQYVNNSVSVESLGLEKYGRTLARIYAPEYLNLQIVRLGLASYYLVQPSEYQIFSNAEAEARKTEKGIWKKSPLYDCISAEIKPQEEYLILTEKCNSSFPISIKDDGTHTYYVFMHASKTQKIFSGKGEPSPGEIYLNSTTNIWNNDKDTLFIRDSSGLLVYFYRYGY